jgi:ATP/maltotriose-dependent transcriptional regulator MalT
MPSTAPNGGSVDDGMNSRLPGNPMMSNPDSPAKVGPIQWEPISEKVQLPAPIWSISRPRLLKLLEDSLSSCSSTIICGRAGTGKTALAVDFAEKSAWSVAWYKVDAPENAATIFFRYLIQSIRTQRRDFGSDSLEIMVEDQKDSSNISRLAEEFVFELERGSGSPLLIVIEDLHLVFDADWMVPFFRRLLLLLPADVHVVITSRTMPPAPLWRMRSKQTLSVIDEETLAFTRDEAIRLFEQYGLNREQARIALDHARGRAGALSNLATTLHATKIESCRRSLNAVD